MDSGHPHPTRERDLDELRARIARLEQREARRHRRLGLAVRAAGALIALGSLGVGGVALADPQSPFACDPTAHGFLYCFGSGAPRPAQINSNFEALADRVDASADALGLRIDGILVPGAVDSSHVADGSLAVTDLVGGGCPAGQLVRTTASGAFECSAAYRRATGAYSASVNGGDASGADRIRVPMIPTSSGSCFLTSVAIDDADTFGELPACAIVDVGGTWTLEAAVADVGGPSVYEDARANCTATCLQY